MVDQLRVEQTKRRFQEWTGVPVVGEPKRKTPHWTAGSKAKVPGGPMAMPEETAAEMVDWGEKR